MTTHLGQLAERHDHEGEPDARLEAVLHAYALIRYETREYHNSELAAFLHRDERTAHAHRHLRGMIQGLLTEGAARAASVMTSHRRSLPITAPTD